MAVLLVAARRMPCPVARLAHPRHYLPARLIVLARRALLQLGQKCPAAVGAAIGCVHKVEVGVAVQIETAQFPAHMLPTLQASTQANNQHVLKGRDQRSPNIVRS
eukprot:scaffold869_cov105-Isochrysis_galbana.AAC.37